MEVQLDREQKNAGTAHIPRAGALRAEIERIAGPRGVGDVAGPVKQDEVIEPARNIMFCIPGAWQLQAFRKQISCLFTNICSALAC